MKTIVVPTDFSITADSALNFSMVIARQQKAKIILLHTFELPVPVAPITFEILQMERVQMKLKTEKKLEQLCNKISHAGGINYEYHVEEGDVVDSIVAFAKNRQADMIIMGTGGENSIGDFIFGSVTSSVIEKASCPVLAIPSGIHVGRKIRQITYATNFLNTDLSDIAALIKMAIPMEAGITVIHINDDDDNPESEIRRFNEFTGKINKTFDFKKFSFALINGNDVEKDLLEYADSGETDLIVVSTQYRNLWGRLFGTGITNGLVHRLKIPMIAFHHRKATPIKVF
jgi:nucleotide-binding universal stress UspA family protein